MTLAVIENVAVVPEVVWFEGWLEIVMTGAATVSVAAELVTGVALSVALTTHLYVSALFVAYVKPVSAKLAFVAPETLANDPVP